jgi:hypothetical protein
VLCVATRKKEGGRRVSGKNRRKNRLLEKRQITSGFALETMGPWPPKRKEGLKRNRPRPIHLPRQTQVHQTVHTGCDKGKTFFRTKTEKKKEKKKKMIISNNQNHNRLLPDKEETFAIEHNVIK